MIERPEVKLEIRCIAYYDKFALSNIVEVHVYPHMEAGLSTCCQRHVQQRGESLDSTVRYAVQSALSEARRD